MADAQAAGIDAGCSATEDGVNMPNTTSHPTIAVEHPGSRSGSRPPTSRPRRGRPTGRLRAAALGSALLSLPLMAGCDNPLSVENPNNLIEQDLDDPSSVPALVNGSMGTLSQMLNGMLATYSVASDELWAIGSRDAWRQLHRGYVSQPGNEFTDAVYTAASEARYMADRAVEAAERFDAEGTLNDRGQLARAYFFAGLTYTTIADFYEDFVIPPAPGEEAPALGEENMGQLYETAVQHLTDGLRVAGEVGSSELEARILAQRARTRHSRGVWDVLNPPGSTPADPLVSDAEAVQDAEQALAMVGPTSDWEYRFTFTSTTVGGGPTSAASEVNERGALAIGPDYVIADVADPSVIEAIRLEDPIDGIPEPRIQDKLDVFLTNGQFAPYTVISARELHLIVAEASLADGDVTGFEDHINAIRVGMDGLTAYSGQIPALEMLRHERRVNLFLENRRLHDMYRFGETSSLWQPQSDAIQRPGTFFPISLTEILSNPLVDG